MNRIIICICALSIPAILAFRTAIHLPTSDQQPSAAALAYFDEAFSHIRQNAYFHKHLNFREVKQQALAKMKTAQTSADTYDAIRFVLDQLNDRHSFFQPPLADGRNSLSIAVANNQRIPFETSIQDGQYGVLRLRSYNSVNQANAHRIADSLYTCLADFGTRNVKGVIIDLRVMEGGAYPPFLTGLAPLIDTDQLLGFIDRNGKRKQTVRYKNGIYFKSGRKKARLGYLSRYAPLTVASLPIAVLTGKFTASAGEMLLISFLGLSRAKTFGSPTYGVPTGKDNIFLADSAMISLSNSACYDRQKITHTSPIQPDVNCSEEEAATVAKRWIDTVKL